jgi:hypothetical protein
MADLEWMNNLLALQQAANPDQFEAIYQNW